MLAVLRNRTIVGPLVVVVVLSAAAALGDGGAASAAPQAPTSQPRFKAGDVLSVAAERADLMLGRDVLAAVLRGHRIVVVEVRDQWIGTQVVLNGRTTAGWIRTSDFIPAQAPAAPQGAAALPTGYEPSPAAQAHTVNRPVEPRQPTIVVSPSPAQSHASDPYLVGKYLRHEVDPNLHVWEPWRR